MFLNFKQGIISGTNFLSVTSSGLVTTADVTVSISENNLQAIQFSIPTGTTFQTIFPPIQKQWIYVDVTGNGNVQIGSTNIEPISSLTAPSGIENLHWFDLTTEQMKVFRSTSNSFQHVTRVFIAQLLTNGQIQYYTPGSSQVGLDQVGSTYRHGRIIYDVNQQALHQSNGNFLLSTTDLYLEGDVNAGSNLDSSIVIGQANENIGSFKVVKFNGYNNDIGGISLAEYDDIDTALIGFVKEGVTSGQRTNVLLQGVITNSNWDWEAEGADVGSKLYVGADGEAGDLVVYDPHEVDLNRPKQVAVAKVISRTSIYFEQGLGGIGKIGKKGPPGNLAVATTDTVGGAVLSVEPTNPEVPVVVETNDPRLTNARPPTAHVHQASEIIVSSFQGNPSTSAQNWIETLENTKIGESGGVINGVLELNTSATDNNHVTNLQTVNQRINDLAVLKSGSSMTGFLTLSDNPQLPKHAATKEYVDNIAGPETINWVFFDGVNVTSPYIASPRDGVIADTTNTPLTLILPGNPAPGDYVITVPAAATYSQNALTVDGNGNLIGGSSGSTTITDDGLSVDFIFFGGSIGWAVNSGGSTFNIFQPDASSAALFILLKDNGIGHNHVAVVTEQQALDLMSGSVSSVVVISSESDNHTHAITVEYNDVSDAFEITNIASNHLSSPHTATIVCCGDQGSGGISGPATSIDRSIPVFNGTGGDQLVDTSVTIDSVGNLLAAGTKVKIISNVTYSITDDDSGCVLFFTSPSPVSVTVQGVTNLPFTKNISVVLIQGGDGAVTVIDDGESFINTSKPTTTTAAVSSPLSVLRIEDNEYWLTGETAE